ncbi:hypothetical protein V499_01108 [Pseudogymnoascus sp. VKM F-103]|nr:hypothetical protein V499_01108 [Pseudogymnoascus sp. VKM F-103]
MLVRALKLRESIDIYYLKYKENEEDYLLEQDWLELKKLSNFLVYFQDATLASKSRFATVDTTLPIMDFLLEKFEYAKQEYKDDIYMGPCCNAGWAKLEKPSTTIAINQEAQVVQNHYLKWRDDKKGTSQSQLDEYQQYQRSPIIEVPDTDPRSWWLEPTQRKTYPNLSVMALDILSIPAMAAEPERLFSGAKITITDRRNSLEIEAIEAIECLKSWLRKDSVAAVRRRWPSLKKHRTARLPNRCKNSRCCALRICICALRTKASSHSSTATTGSLTRTLPSHPSSLHHVAQHRPSAPPPQVSWSLWPVTAYVTLSSAVVSASQASYTVHRLLRLKYHGVYGQSQLMSRYPLQYSALAKLATPSTVYKKSAKMATPDGLNIKVKSIITDLSSKLSENAKIVTEQGDEWRVLMERWTDIGKHTPAAIVCVATEADIQETVKLCVSRGVKFVPKAGGHSLWSTIGADGVIIDLTAFNAVVVDKEAGIVTVSGGTQIKDVIAPLFAVGLCCPFGTANTVGCIPQAINGGITIFSGILGQTSDAILSARLVTATGALLTISATENPELLYALRGAGSYFGLVTSLTFRASPLSVLNSPDGTIWKTAAFFPATRIGEVVQTLAPIAADPNLNVAGAMRVLKDPMGSGNTIVLCSLVYLGSSEDANAHFAAIKALGPIVWGEKRVSYANINDDFDRFCVTGGYKNHAVIGTPRLQSDPKVWEREVQAYDAMIEKCGAQAAQSMVSFQWVGKAEEGRFPESAFGHRGVKSWIECVSWYVEEGSAQVMKKWEVEALRIAAEGFKKGEVDTFQNATRETPIESRFPGEGRLEKLRALKNEWDSEEWEDSIELTSNISWTPSLPSIFYEKYGYDVKRYLPLIMFGNNNINIQKNEPGSIQCLLDTYDQGAGYVNDFRGALAEGYKRYIYHLTSWTKTSLNLQMSAQVSYNLPMDMGALIPFVSAPECESLELEDNINAYRHFSGPANLGGKRVISNEMGAVRDKAYQYLLSELLWSVNRALAGGVNQFVLHGTNIYWRLLRNHMARLHSFLISIFRVILQETAILSDGFSEVLNYIARAQYTQQIGTPKRDVATYHKDSATDVTFSREDGPTALIKNGYIFTYLSPDNFALPQAYVRKGILAPNGPAYRALIIPGTANMTLEAVKEVRSYALSGLPVILSGGTPNYYMSKDSSNKDVFEKAIQLLKTTQNVYSTSSELVADKLASLDVHPQVKIQTNGTWYPTWREDERDGIDYAFIFSDGPASTATLKLLR